MSIFNFEKDQLVIFPDPNKSYMSLCGINSAESFEMYAFVLFLYKTGTMLTHKVRIKILDETFTTELAVSDWVKIKTITRESNDWWGKVRFDIDFNVIEATKYQVVAEFDGYDLLDYSVGFALNYPFAAYDDPVNRYVSSAYIEVYKKEFYQAWL